MIPVYREWTAPRDTISVHTSTPRTGFDSDYHALATTPICEATSVGKLEDTEQSLAILAAGLDHKVNGR